MEAILKASHDAAFPATCVGVISNRPKAGGLNIAKTMGVATQVVDHTAFSDREGFETELHAAIRNFGADFIVCAGFMRLLTAGFVNNWAGKQLNIHPSLLPSFKGLNTHQRALDAGVLLHGCTVHLVTAEMDDGPILGQAAFPILKGDTEKTLAARTLEIEHALYPECIKTFCQNGLRRSRSRTPRLLKFTDSEGLMSY